MSMPLAMLEQVTYSQFHCAQFNCGCDAVVYILRQDASESISFRQIIPMGWSLEKDCVAGQSSWVEFHSDEPFLKEELERVKRKIQLLLDAFVAMAKDTKAEGQ